MSPGGHRNLDYLKAGGPMTVLFIVIAVAGIYRRAIFKESRMIVQQFFVKDFLQLLSVGGSTTAPSSIRNATSRNTSMRRTIRGMTTTHILETHLHADFISGQSDLAAATGA